MTNAYLAPGDLGADRWVAMIAAHHQVEGAVCVFDCGTAITVDLVAASGEHRGGLILPGIDMLVETLQVNTAGIRLPDEATLTDLLGRGTREGVTGGTQQLLAAACAWALHLSVARQGQGPRHRSGERLERDLAFQH